ncbi:MAG: hypothetical protein ACK2UJ_17280 [Candidatus Promineifilaceae bacterium]
MSETYQAQETAVSDPEAIDALKKQEKEKLSAAEDVYKQRRVKVAAAEPVVNEETHETAVRCQRNNTWFPGVFLVAAGILFLLKNITGFTVNNWWALFILIPAVGNFSKAADAVRREGFDRHAWGALSMGFVLTLVASAFLFGLSWNLIWPLFLIIAGTGIFLGAWKSW